MVNVRSLDRSTRFTAGAAFLVSLFLLPIPVFFAVLGASKFVQAALGLVSLETVLHRFDTAFTFFGIRRCLFSKT